MLPPNRKKSNATKSTAVVGTPATTKGMQPEYDVTAAVRLDPHNPIPLELENKFGFSPGGNLYIPFFAGSDKFYGFDNFFINILQARQQSTTQNACVIAKTKYTTGDGVYATENSEKAENDQLWQSFTKSSNAGGQSLNKILKDIVENFYTFGNVPIEIVRGQVGGKRFLYVYVKNTLDCRKAWPDANGVSNAMIISRFFRKKGVMNLTEKFNVRIPFYRSGAGTKSEYWMKDTMAKGNKDGDGIPPDNIPNGIKVERTALWLKDDYPGYDHYGLPSWLSAQLWTMLEYECGHFNLDNINNNMNPGGMLILQGSLTDIEVNKLARNINKQYTGKGKIGRQLVVGSEEGIQDSKYTPFNTDKNGSYQELINLCRDEIISANEWDGALLGKGEKGTMGKGGSYLNELYQQKIKTVIKPVHRLIKDDFLTPLCEIADDWLGTNWSSYDLDIQVTRLFDDTTEATTTVNGINAFLKVVEMVRSGAFPLDAAVKFVSARFGLSEKDAKEQLGNIEVQKEEPQGPKGGVENV